MPFDPSGTYTPPTGAENAAPGQVLQSAVWNNIFTDIADAITTTYGKILLSSGQVGSGLSVYGVSGTASGTASFITGLAGQVLQVNKAGTALGFANSTTGISIISVSTTWPVPTGITQMVVQGWGAGGSGAGGNTATSARLGGGGGGGYFLKNYTGVMDSTLTINIGAGGLGVANGSGGATGNPGGTTTVFGINFGTATARGGTGGVSDGTGGTGGTASGGDENISGEDGQTGSTSSAYNGIVFGGGGSPRGGPGGRMNVATDGKIPGGGGSCGNHVVGTSGGGVRGQVVIWTR